MPRRTVQDVVDDMGFGMFQVKSVTIGGSTYFADGAEILILGAVTAMVAKEWGMPVWQKGAVVSIVFLGVLFGNLISGALGDYFGRRVPILVSFLGVFFFSCASATADGFESLASLRFLVGISFGIGIPAWNTLCCEHCPSDYRSYMNGVGQCMFAMGELYSAFLLYMDDPTLQHLHWRRLVILAALPGAIFFGLALWLLDESPSFLAMHGRTDKAKDILARAAKLNKFEGSLHFDPVVIDQGDADRSCQKATWDQMSIVFGRRYAFTTVTIMLCIFTLNFCYYGQLYALPQVLPDMDLPVAPAVSLMIGAVLEIPGFLLGIYIGQTCNRLPSMIGYLIACVITLGLFVLGAMVLTGEIIIGGIGPFSAVQVAQGLVLFGLNTNKIVISIGWLMLYLYSAEVFPGVCRVTGAAACIAAGRLGAIASPLLFEEMLAHYGSFVPYFGACATLCLFNITFTAMLPIETKGRKLQDREDEPIMEEVLAKEVKSAA
mmetsp:Transcript_1761/g.3920  ORF Transcript_1761/g.3920 Transcript_1761/m.3920 type:complete len:491 (+) Transcript_1761:92-1564(+)